MKNSKKNKAFVKPSGAKQSENFIHSALDVFESVKRIIRDNSEVAVAAVTFDLAVNKAIDASLNSGGEND